MQKALTLSIIFGVTLTTALNSLAAHEADDTTITHSLATCFHDPKTTQGLEHKLLIGAQLKSIRMVAYALAQGVPVDYQDEDGNTALHYATTPAWSLNEYITKDCEGLYNLNPSAYYCPEIVRQLVAAGANPHIINKEGITPLSAAGFRLRALRIVETDTKVSRAAERCYQAILDTLEQAIAKKSTT